MAFFTTNTNAPEKPVHNEPITVDYSTNKEILNATVPTLDELHVKYRPVTFDEMIGQEELVKSLQSVLAQPNPPHAYLFTGESGCGKTTLARIISHELGIEPESVMEAESKAAR